MWFAANSEVVPETFMVGVEPADIGTPGEYGFTLPLLGWVAHLGRVPSAIRIECAGNTLARQRLSLPRPDVDAYLSKLDPQPPQARMVAVGFQVSLSKLILPPDATCDLVCEFDDGQNPARITIGRIGGFTPLPAIAQADGFSPILIPAMGRSGTTLMAGLLGSHPDILVAGGYPFENRLASYYWHTAHITSAPAHHGESLHPDGFERFAHMTGYNPYNERDFTVGLGVPSIREWLNTERVIENIEHARRGIDGFYARLAAGLGKPSARLFIEKALVSPLLDVAWHIHPAAREVFLVRDFRDNFISARAFNELRQTHSFDRDQFASDTEWLKGRADDARRVAETYQSRRSRCLLVRYEDLISNQEQELRRIFHHIGVASDPTVIQAVREAVAAGFTEGPGQHQTSASAEMSVGRWRRELTPEEQEHATNLFRVPLELFGYPLA